MGQNCRGNRLGGSGYVSLEALAGVEGLECPNNGFGQRRLCLVECCVFQRSDFACLFRIHFDTSLPWRVTQPE